MKKGFKLAIAFVALLLCLMLLMSCKDNGADAQSSQSTESTSAQTTVEGTSAQTTEAESTSAQTTDTESAETSDTDASTSAETSAETQKGGIGPGEDSDYVWGEFEPA